MMLNFSFNNPPLDNIAFLLTKKPQVDFDRSDIYQAAHQRAFTVARIANIDLLAEIQVSLENAFVEGQSYNEWVKELKPTLQKAGWFGKSVEVTNPKTGEKKMIEVGASRLKKIFYTNARTAYAQSRARQQYESDDEYLRYVAIMDSRTRHSHAQMHGLVLKKTDDFWKRNYPPNGWNCRCRVDSYSKADLDEFGFKESTQTRALNIADEDFDYDTRNLQRDDSDLQRIIEKKLELYEKRHLSNAVKALRALKDKLVENETRYKAVKGLWDKAVKLTMQEAKGEAGREFVKIATASDELKKAFNTAADEVRLSVWTIKSHLARKSITAFDYSIIQYAINKPYKIVPSKNKDEHILLFSKYGIYYRAVFKLTDNNEIYLQSLLSRAKEIK